ncbi:RluA family pseudouridine synthase [Parasphingorhabdus sp. DH2-15]|uniref:RluA family pseudouridine synthase n=1 Tax=Parasphingorhabdus sp. DH2-15 TaxID=3444112 RepID=UPI003F6834FC
MSEDDKSADTTGPDIGVDKTGAGDSAGDGGAWSPDSPQVRSFTVKADDNDIRVDRWFARHMAHIGFGTVSRWARTGQLRLDGKRVSHSDRISTGQVLRVPPDDRAKPSKTIRRKELNDEETALAEGMVIHRDRAALILNKPPGLATQGGSKTYKHVDGLLDAYIEGDEGPRPRLVHRLDKDTSGVLLVARSPGSAAFFSRHFSGRSARKTYWALVMGLPEIREGQIDLPLAKQPGTGGEKMFVDEVEGQSARTRYRVLEHAGGRVSWVELFPLTGRTHQLRVHMAAIGHPILGDIKYGGKDAHLTGSISRKMHLHARHLRIDHPDGGKLEVKADLPPHFADTMDGLGFDMEIGDAFNPVDHAPEPTREEQKRKARAHAKQMRKGRRGERRGRGVADDGKKPSGPARGRGKPKIGAKTGSNSKKPMMKKGASGSRSGPAGGRSAPARNKSGKRG